MMMEQDPMVSGYSGCGEEKRNQNGRFTHGDDADTSNWHKQDMVAWLAKLEQPQQENDVGETGIGNLTMQDHQNGAGVVNSEQYHPMLAVSPNTLMPVVGQQSESGLLTKVTPRNAAGMAIPRLKTTLVKDNRPHITNHWNIKSEDVAECRKWGTKCSCPNANVKIVFRNRTKLEYVRDYNKHNEPSDAVKETLVDRYMMKIACIIKSYEPKSAELLKHKTFLLGQKHQSWLVSGWEGEGRFRSSETQKQGEAEKNVAYGTNSRGKRGNANRHNNQGAARLWSQPSFSSPPPPFPTPPQAVRKKGNM